MTVIEAPWDSIAAAVMTIFAAVIETMFTVTGITAEFTVITARLRVIEADPRVIVAAFEARRFDVAFFTARSTRMQSAVTSIVAPLPSIAAAVATIVVELIETKSTATGITA